LFIILIAMIILGPNDMVKASRTIGKFLRKLVTSPTWGAIQQTSREIRYLPNKLMREAGLDEEVKTLNEIGASVQKMGNFQAGINLNPPEKSGPGAPSDLSAWTTPPAAAGETLQAPEQPAASPASAPAEETKPTQESDPS
jgi:Sec-independent protein translocase protein TatA